MIQQVLELVARASSSIMEVYRSDDFEPTLKGDNSPLTRADVLASAILVEGLEKFSQIAVVSEERTLPYAQRKSLERFWLVDPLDGTKDFLARDDEFTVNVALVENGEPILGVVGAPALEVVYWAERGRGAYRVDKAGAMKIAYRRERTELVCADSRLHSSSRTKEFCAKNGIAKIVPSGSAIKMCKLAEGVVDVYPRFGPTMEWDVGASQVIAEEAGCQVVDLETRQKLKYNKEDMRNPGFIAYPKALEFVW